MVKSVLSMASHNLDVLPTTHGSGKEIVMLTTYFEASYALRRFRRPTTARYIESFAKFLAENSYAEVTGRGYIRAAAQFAAWADSAAIPVARLDEGAIAQFAVKRRRKAGAVLRRPGKFELAYLPLFVQHLRSLGVVPPRPSETPKMPRLAAAFGSWVYKNRGVQLTTKDQYEVTIALVIAKLGSNPTKYTPSKIRQYIKDWGQSHGIASTKFTISVVRSFLRYLIVEGRCRVGLDAAVPTVPCWRLTSLPRYIGPADVERVVVASNDESHRGARDHAVVLLIARLGLRACEVARLQLGDISWKTGTFTVRGKGRKNVVLPLPQDVGDAVARYIQVRPQHADSRVFLRIRAPFRPLGCAESVSGIVRAALRRAGMHGVPHQGAHLLRHSVATGLLRSGASLDGVRALLRHSSSETTAVYAKVDVNMLKSVARPWPTTEVA
jgi:site-specific recombinase XerD